MKIIIVAFLRTLSYIVILRPPANKDATLPRIKQIPPTEARKQNNKRNKNSINKNREEERLDNSSSVHLTYSHALHFIGTNIRDIGDK